MNAIDPTTRFLIIRLSSIGDIVLTTPLIRCLKQHYPNSQIDFVVKAKYAELLQHHPALHDIYRFPDHGGLSALWDARAWVKAREYACILDLHKNIRSLLLTRALGGTTVLRFKKFGYRRFLLVKFGINLYRRIVPVYQRYLEAAADLGVEDDGRGTELFVPRSVVEGLLSRLQLYGIETKKIVAFAPGAGYFTKRWPVDYFVILARQAIEAGYTPVILGDRQDVPVARAICEQAPGAVHFAGKLSLLESAALLQLASLLICNDTGQMHMAEAVGTPVVALFGSTVEEFGFFPVLENSVVVENRDISCRPCSHVGRNTCPEGHFLCMRSLLPEQVWQAALTILNQ